MGKSIESLHVEYQWLLSDVLHNRDLEPLGHDGDEDSGCYPECAKCAWDSARAHMEHLDEQLSKIQAVNWRLLYAEERCKSASRRWGFVPMWFLFGDMFFSPATPFQKKVVTLFLVLIMVVHAAVIIVDIVKAQKALKRAEKAVEEERKEILEIQNRFTEMAVSRRVKSSFLSEHNAELD